MGAFVIIITNNRTNMEEVRCLVGSGQGLQMSGGLSEHVLDIEEDLWPQTAPEPVAVLCSLLHVTSLGLLSALVGEF